MNLTIMHLRFVQRRSLNIYLPINLGHCSTVTTRLIGLGASIIRYVTKRQFVAILLVPTLLTALFPRLQYADDGAFSPSSARKLYDCKQIGAIAFSPDGQYVLVGEADLKGGLQTGRATMIRVKDGKTDLIFDRRRIIESIAFAPDGRQCAIGTDRVMVYDLPGLKEQSAFETGWPFVGSVVFSQDGARLACGAHNANDTKNTVCVWELKSHKRLLSLKEGVDSPAERYANITGLAFTQNSERLVVTGSGKNLVVLNSKNGSRISSWTHDDGNISSFAMSNDGAVIATGSDTGVVSIWSDKGKLVATIKSKKYDDGDRVNALSFVDDRKLIAIGFAGAGLMLCDSLTGAFRTELDAGNVVKLSSTSDGSQLVGAVAKDLDAAQVVVWSKGKVIKLQNGREEKGM